MWCNCIHVFPITYDYTGAANRPHISGFQQTYVLVVISKQKLWLETDPVVGYNGFRFNCERERKSTLERVCVGLASLSFGVCGRERERWGEIDSGGQGCENSIGETSSQMLSQ